MYIKAITVIDDGQWVCSEYITSKAVLAKSVTSKRDLNKLVEESVLHLARVGSKRTYEAIMMFVNQRGPINDSHTSNIFKTL